MVKAKVRSAGGSNPGRVRGNNEDAFYIDADRGIFLVVDGIGGQAAGEKAAEIAVARLRARLERLTGTTEQRIREGITMANNEILSQAASRPEWKGMACVLTVAVMENGSAVVGHVGDSRLYQVRSGQIRKITHDHSPVGEREDNQELTEAQAMRHPRRNEVFRDVGSEEHSPNDPDFIEIQRIVFEPDSALLLCSDGLSDQVPSREILRIVEQNAAAPDRAVEELIDAANRAGGKDNVTVVLVEGEQFTAPDPPSVPVRKSRSKSLLSHLAFLLLGILLAAAGAWFSRAYWVPKPVIIEPRILAAGSGSEFSTIQAAIDQARSGDTVEVAPGEYHEQLRLKSHIHVRSRGPREAILRAAPAGANAAILGENVQDVRVSGFLVRGDEREPLSAGIVLRNSEVELYNMEITSATIGVEIHGGNAPVLSGSAIHDCLTAGILIAGNSRAWILHNSVQRNKGAGLAAKEGARPVLIGNVFEKNGVAVAMEADVPTDSVRARNFFLDAGRGAARGGRVPAPAAVPEGR